jgi:Uma2 family endonuclease
MAVPLPRHKFTVDEYHKMAENGVLTEDDRVELIDGEIIDMAPIGELHFGHVNRFNAVFSRRFVDRAVVHIQNPVRLGSHREPQPDVVLLKYREDYYQARMPTPEDVLLLVEVADSSLDYDRHTKIPLYSEAGILEYWIVNLVEDHILVYRNPGPAGYGVVQVLRRGDTICPLAFPDVEIAVSDLLRPRA